VGLYGLLPLILIIGGVALAINHTWVVAAILISMGVFGLWLIARYGDSGPMRPG
jgi:TRAP-type mannitol/chloroaromatic compound transport system permease large subunit